MGICRMCAAVKGKGLFAVLAMYHRNRCAQVLIQNHIAGVDAASIQNGLYPLPHRIISDFSNKAGFYPQPRKRTGNVGRASADTLFKDRSTVLLCFLRNLIFRTFGIFHRLTAGISRAQWNKIHQCFSYTEYFIHKIAPFLLKTDAGKSSAETSDGQSTSKRLVSYDQPEQEMLSFPAPDYLLSVR